MSCTVKLCQTTILSGFFTSQITLFKPIFAYLWGNPANFLTQPPNNTPFNVSGFFTVLITVLIRRFTINKALQGFF